MTIDDFISSLQYYHRDGVFNPWNEFDSRCDIDETAPLIRRRQLRYYLQLRVSQARYLLIAEAAGYHSCRFAVPAITCQRMLLNAHKKIPASFIFDCAGQRTSRPDCVYMTSKPQCLHGMNEPTDTYVWGAIADNGLSSSDVLLWNIFPFHPHKESPFSNRTPTEAELAEGLIYTQQLLTLCRPGIMIGAIGQKSAQTLSEAGIPAAVMRHPANGGASLFRQQFAQWAAGIAEL